MPLPGHYDDFFIKIKEKLIIASFLLHILCNKGLFILISLVYSYLIDLSRQSSDNYFIIISLIYFNIG